MLDGAPKISPELWRKIKAEHTRRRKQQPNLIDETQIWKLEVERKLAIADKNTSQSLQDEPWYVNFFRCGRETGFVMCASCGRGKPAPYQCSQKWCPACNWRISAKRKRLLEQITYGMPQLKHVVLTQRNFQDLTPGKIDQSRKALFALRRRKVFEKKANGCASLEFTNEKAGWHLHWHLLLTQKWIEAHTLSKVWGELVGQEFAIVKVKAVTEKEFLQEICKYVVKAAEFVKWTPEQIVQFITVIRKKRCFSTFGKFRQIAKFARAVIASEKEPCCCKECGATDLVFGHDEAHCSRIISKIYG
jgi:Replication protein